MRRNTHLPALAVAVLLCAAPCCGGDTCSYHLRFRGPVPDQTLAPSDTTSYPLLRVWAMEGSCSGSPIPEAHLPSLQVQVDRPGVAGARLGEDGRLHLTAHAEGRTRVVLKAKASEDCETVYDATHFTVTVARAGTPAAP